MVERLRQFWSAPVFPDNDDRTRTAANLFLLLRVTLVGTIALVVLLATGLSLIVAVVLSLLVHLAWMALAHRGYVRLSATLLAFIVWATLMSSAIDTGGVQAIGYTGGGMLSVLLAGLLLRRRHIFTFFVLTVMWGVVMSWLDVSGQLPASRVTDTPASRLIAYSLFLLVGSTLAFIALRSVQQALDKARESSSRYRTIHGVAQDISSLADLDTTLRRVLANLCESLPLDVFFVALHDPNTDAVTYPIMYDDGQFWDQGPGTLTHDGWIGQVINTRQPLCINRTQAEIDEDGWAETRLGAVSRISASVLMAPLIVGDRVIGVISIHSYTRNSYHEGHLDFLVAAGYQIAVAVQNARLYDSLRLELAERQRLEAQLQEYTNQLEQQVAERTQALRRAKEQFELVLNNTSNALAFADPQGDILVANPAFDSTFHHMPAIEFILWSLADDEQIVAVGEALLRVIRDQEPQQLVVQINGADNRLRDVDITLVPVNHTDDESHNGVLLSGHDITQLKEVERFKARFVADAVHDLATPITGLSTRIYLLKRSPEKLAEHVRALENQVRHLSNLLDDLRTLSQMDRGQLALDFALHNLNAVFQRVFDTYEPVALNKQQTLTLNTVANLPDVRVDERQIERVLVNLVANAVNYTPEAKAIRIDAALNNEHLVVSVTDQGIGIAAEDLPRIFERFYRTDEARQQVASGTGLGLAISKEIVELHGGTLTVESQPGSGSVFTMHLPLFLPLLDQTRTT